MRWIEQFRMADVDVVPPQGRKPRGLTTNSRSTLTSR